MKMGKKVREYKSGDFIFAKVKGYPAWPARVQRMNGKKYFVYFYGTGETANLPPNMIFDYMENKDKFLNKTVKRKDFNDGVRQIEHDFANNVPLEQVIGIAPQEPAEPANGLNESTANETVDDSAMGDTTATDDTADETANTTQNDSAIEDSDETGALVIDEGKQQQKGRKSTSKTQVKETPKAKEPKTPRGKKNDDEEKKEEEIVSRSGRKIRPKRYMDEQTEENATLPSPAPKKRRVASPSSDKEKDKSDKNIKNYIAISQLELEELKEPFTTDDPEKDNILIACLPSGQYIGVKLFQSRPTNFKSDSSRMQWTKQAAANAITLKMQLEQGHITPQSLSAQLVMDLSLSDEEKATLDKEREIEEKKTRVHFLKTEMKLIELDAKIKTCLSLEKADTELCLKLLDELMDLEVKPLMLLKHPTCLETVKRMRAYVGNTPSWDLSESAALMFSKEAHKIRKQADILYKNMKDLFVTPDGLSFYEYFSERVMQFKKATSKLNADELLEMVHEPLEMSMPATMQTAIDVINEDEPLEEVDKEPAAKKKSPGKAKKAANTPSKPPLKRQSSRKQQQEEKDKEKESNKETERTEEEMEVDNSEKSDSIDKSETNKDKLDAEKLSPSENVNEKEIAEETNADKDSESTDVEMKDAEAEPSSDDTVKDNKKTTKDKGKDDKSKEKESNGKSTKEKEKGVKDKESSKSSKDKDDDKNSNGTEGNKEDKVEGDKEKEKEKEVDEPRAKRSRENKKTEPLTPKSPAKRRSKS